MHMQEPKPALWKSAIIAAIALLVLAGFVVVVSTLPVTTGELRP